MQQLIKDFSRSISAEHSDEVEKMGSPAHNINAVRQVEAVSSQVRNTIDQAQTQMERDLKLISDSKKPISCPNEQSKLLLASESSP